MTQHKIVVCDHIHESGINFLKEQKDIDLVIAWDVPKDELLDIVAGADVAITRSSTDVDEKFINAAKNVKAVVRAGVGVDNVDIDGCSKNGIIVMNVPTANTIAAVELTMTHMLSCMRMFPYSHAHLKNERVWKREKWYGNELKDKKLGVIGFGNIGSRVATRAQAFEMDVIAYDPYIAASKVTELGMTYTTDFEDILACDIITIHTPKNKETLNIIDREEIAKMNDGVILINCARGGLYNEEALKEGLDSGKVKFAGIDVFSYEPATDHPLLDCENICVSPHLGANTRESQYKISIQAAEQAVEAARGVGYPNALNLPIKESEMPKFVKPYLELAQKLGYFAAQTNKAPIKSIKVTGEGEIADYLESLTTFTTVGVMAESLGDKINYVNAEYIAKDRGVKLSFDKTCSSSAYKNKISVKLTTDKDVVSICGTIFNDDVQRIVEVNGFSLDINPKGKMILFKNSDVPGVIGQVGNILAKHEINIADFRLGRDNHHNALSVIIVDDNVPQVVLDELAQLEASLGVNYVIL